MSRPVQVPRRLEEPLRRWGGGPSPARRDRRLVRVAGEPCAGGLFCAVGDPGALCRELRVHRAQRGRRRGVPRQRPLYASSSHGVLFCRFGGRVLGRILKITAFPLRSSAYAAAPEQVQPCSRRIVVHPRAACFLVCKPGLWGITTQILRSPMTPPKLRSSACNVGATAL